MFCRTSFPFMTNPIFSSNDLILKCPAMLKATLCKLINKQKLSDLFVKLQCYKINTNDRKLSLFYWHFPASLTQKFKIKLLEGRNLVPLQGQTPPVWDIQHLHLSAVVLQQCGEVAPSSTLPALPVYPDQSTAWKQVLPLTKLLMFSAHKVWILLATNLLAATVGLKYLLRGKVTFGSVVTVNVCRALYAFGSGHWDEAQGAFLGPSAVRRRQWLPAAWNEPAGANMQVTINLKENLNSWLQS